MKINAVLAVAAALAAGVASAAVELGSGWEFSPSMHERNANIGFLSRLLGAEKPDADYGKNDPCLGPDGRGWWRPVTVPHDYGATLAGDVNLDHQDACRDLARGGIYRYFFRLDAAMKKTLAEGGRLYFETDGAMNFGRVWINRRFVGGHPYGYTPWRVELTKYVDPEGENCLNVRVSHFRESSRFYTGLGLTRPCRLAAYPADHVIPGSVFIRATEITAKSAKIVVDWQRTLGGAGHDEFTLENPRRWDIDDPYLYVYELDGEQYRYGVRTAEFFADERGFQLNGRRVQLQGVCLHEDLGPLGQAYCRTAWRRRLEKLKTAGVNAVRMSHYRHPAGVYELCDEMGLLVMDEVFDQWSGGFNRFDYHVLFDDWFEKDLRACVRANRNHPSIVIYSPGNEIVEQRSDLGQLDLKLFERNGREVRRILREEDSTRPMTTANNNSRICTSNEVDFVDVYGFNYRPMLFAEYRRARPAKPMLSTECVCFLAPRGEFMFGADDRPSTEYVDFRANAYLNRALTLADVEWAAQDANPSHCGGFAWTGFDYLGGTGLAPELRRSTASRDPARSREMAREIEEFGAVQQSVKACPTGLFDLAGFEKEVYWLFRSRWLKDTPTVYIIPHWNWNLDRPGYNRVGRVTPVEVFSSGDEVELFQDGRSLGRRRRDAKLFRFLFPEVVYSPGELRAVAYRDGKVWAETKVETTGPAVRYEVTPEPFREGDEYAWFTVRALDAEGRFVPTCCDEVVIEGEGFVAAENGDECDMSSSAARRRRLHNGLLSVMTRPKASAPVVVKK